MPNKQFSILSDGTTSYDVKDATARTDISTLDAKVDALEVSDLADTNISNPTDGQSLVYDETSGKWINDTGASKEWVGTSAELAQAIQDGDIEDDTNILVTNDYTPGGGGSSLSHLLITSASDSEISILKPDGVSTVIPTQVTGSTTQWECDVDEFGSYTINILLGSSTYTHTFDLKMVGVYSIVYDSVNLVWSEKSFLKFGLLSDIDVSDAVDGEVLKYNGTTHKWENGEPSSNGLLPQLTVVAPDMASAVSISDGTTTIDLTKKQGSTTDWECEVPSYGTWTVTVTISSTDSTYNINIDAVDSYVLTYDSVSGWKFKSSETLNALSNVEISSVTNGQVLTYDSISNKWKNEDVSGGTLSEIFVDYTSDLVGATITLTHTASAEGHTAESYSFVADNTGEHEVDVRNLGTWVISESLYGTSKTLEIHYFGYYHVNIGYTMYGFHVDSTVANPSDAVSYEVQYDGKNVENYNFEPSSMNFSNDTWNWGDWVGDEFFMPKPVLISQDYSDKIYLNPDDYTKDVNENDVTAKLNGTTDGYNAMMEWGRDGRRIWYKLVPDTDPATYTVYISDIQVDNSFHAWSFYNENDKLEPHFYTSIYNGSVVNNTLRSLSGKTPNNTTAGATQITYAKANNKNGESCAWYIDTFADRILINLLTVLVTKSISTDVIGYGNYTGGSSASSLIQTGLGNTKGLFYGKQSNSVCKVFGMENWYANCWRRMAGLVLSSGTQLYKLTYGTADGSSAAGYIENDNAPANYISGNTIATNLSSSYIVKENAYSNGALLANTFGGSNGNYYSDACWSSTGVKYAIVGGGCDNSSACGGFALILHIALSVSYWAFGASPSLRPVTVTE